MPRYSAPRVVLPKYHSRWLSGQLRFSNNWNNCMLSRRRPCVQTCRWRSSWPTQGRVAHWLTWKSTWMASTTPDLCSPYAKSSPHCATGWGRQRTRPRHLSNFPPGILKGAPHEVGQDKIESHQTFGDTCGFDGYCPSARHGVCSAEARSCGNAGRGQARAVPQGDGRTRLRGHEESPDHEMVPAIAGTDAAGELQTI